MGYRSDGCLAITGKSAEKIEKHLEEGKKYAELCPFLEYCSVDADNGIIFFEFESLKMYNSYPEVAEFYAWINSLDEDDYLYIELGEDGATQEVGGHCELIYTRSEICRY